MHLSVDSKKPVATLRADLERACARHGFAVVGVTDANDRVREAGVASARGAFVVELADPLPRVEADGSREAGTTWRIAGYERPGGGTRLSTMRPTQLLDLFGHPELAGDAARLERALTAALEEAAAPPDPA